MAQEVEHLPSKYKALSSNQNNNKTKHRRDTRIRLRRGSEDTGRVQRSLSQRARCFKRNQPHQHFDLELPIRK
jgi:hypothetical protein